MISHGRSLRGAGRVLASLWPEGAGAGRALSFVATGTPVALLAFLTLRRILDATGGIPAAPLDDAYIHFQFARAFAAGEPLVYSPGAGPVAGATSVLWPLLLAGPYLLGWREHSIVWAAWAFGFVALGLLAWEVRRAAEKLCSPLCAAGASALVLAFGANLWFAASAMEVVPFAWLLMRAVRRSAEWCEGAGGGIGSAARLRELIALAVALPLTRPEGAFVSVLVAGAVAFEPRGKSRLWALAPLAGALSPLLFNLLFAGDVSSTTARAKWLPFNPYTTPERLLGGFVDYLGLLVGTLLDGKVWSALFLPSGTAFFALASLAALAVAGYRRAAKARAALLFLLALGVLVPATYDCPLCNRLRYLWPFFPAWMVGTAALAEQAGEALGRLGRGLEQSALLFVGGAAGALAGYLPFSIDDVAQSSRAIFRQQVSLGLWARERLPANARIGVNDAGAITYFSGRPTFDIVGLTTAGEAKYWTAGPGSRFEHYERLGRTKLPTHFIVYPEWFRIDPLLGEELTARHVPDATILGGARMAAYVADYSALGSGEVLDPTILRGRPVIDRLDVADLEIEAAHGYQLFDAEQRFNVVLGSGSRLDGARAQRSLEVFSLVLEPGGALVLRVAAERDLVLEVQVGPERFLTDVPASDWRELVLELPSKTPHGRASLTVQARGGRFSS
ncbi:MAG TPA: hypothetical protein VIM73_18085, partial [Polyangiaceae bacterium]